MAFTDPRVGARSLLFLRNGFTSGEDQSGREPTVVLSERLWRSRCASDPDIVGKVITLGGRLHIVVGVSLQASSFGSAMWKHGRFFRSARPRGGGRTLSVDWHGSNRG